MTDESDSQGAGTRFDDWHAEQNVQPIIQQPSLRVYGKYDTGMRTGGAELREHVPAGFNPRILLLDLVDTEDPDGGIVDVEGRFKADKGQYDSVTVTNSHGESISLEVEEIQ
jgi:hypothetical protein